MGTARMILQTSKGGKKGENCLKKRKRLLVEILGVVVCTRRIVKMKEHVPFCREFIILCVEDRVVVNLVV